MILKEHLKIKLFLMSQTKKSISVYLHGSHCPNRLLHSYSASLSWLFHGISSNANIYISL